MIGCIRRAVFAFLAGVWQVEQCEGCRRPITGEPYCDVEGVQLCSACWWACAAPESVL